MKIVRYISWAIVIVAASLVLLADVAARRGYADQDREHANEAPSRTYPLGTDELGRDRAARLIYGSRVSFLLAPAAAAIATGLALLMGLAAGYMGRFVEGGVMGFSDVLASVPTLFLLLAARAVLPLDITPAASVCITFLLLGCLGWTSNARVVRAAVGNIQDSSWLLQARAAGSPQMRILARQVVPSLMPVASAAFWTSIPLFLIAEANLGLLGLGVTEPLPSLGSLLADLQNFHDLTSTPWRLAPAVVLILVITASSVLTSTAKEQR